MADISPVRATIQLAGSQFLAAVSESFAQNMGQMLNFISYFQHSEKQFFLNGVYDIIADPQLGVDGLVVFEFAAQIIDVWMFNLTAGSSGTTELDLKLATTSGGTFTSIFTTTPKITSAASNNTWVGAPNPTLVGSQYSPAAYSPPTGTTQPVLDSSVTNSIPIYSALRLDKLSSMVGGQNTGLIVHYRPI